MHKRGIRRYISRCLARGYTKESIKNRLIQSGFEQKYIDWEFRTIHSTRAWIYSVLVILLLSIVLFVKPDITGNVTSQVKEGFNYATITYNRDYGLVYQGESNNRDLLIRDFSSTSIQGKTFGSINLMDYDNNGEVDLFTTGRYKVGEESKLSSDLYRGGKGGPIKNFVSVENSDSCWADFNNDGFVEPALIGKTEDSQIFAVYISKGSSYDTLTPAPGIRDGKILCTDLNNDGWIDLVVAGGGRLEAYANSKGTFEKKQELSGISFAAASSNDFNNDGYMDFVVAGDMPNTGTFFYENKGEFNFNKNSISSFQQISYPSLSSADYDNDGLSDFILLTSDVQAVTSIWKNNGGTFNDVGIVDKFSEGEAYFYNKDNILNLFVTGRFGKEIAINYVFSSTPNSQPSAPTNLNYTFDDSKEYVKFTWSKAEDKETKSLFYNVRAYITESNQNQLISGVLYDPKGNAELNTFKLLKNPCNNGIQTFYFQVQSIDGQYYASPWSPPFKIDCNPKTDNNQTLNQSNSTNTTNIPPITEKNTTVELLAPINETDEPSTWTYTLKHDKLIYKSAYTKKEDSIEVHEIITNEDIVSYENIRVWHDERFTILDYGSYSRNLDYNIPTLAPGETISLKLEIKGAKYNQVLPTGIDAKKHKESPVLATELNETITQEENKTIITVPVKLNDSVITAQEVYIKQTIPKCLIEKINEMVAKSNRQYVVVEEDPVIMWYLDDITDEKELELQIDGVAEANCTNQIVTEIVAKRFIIQKDKIDWMNVSVLLVCTILITIGVYFFISNAKEYNRKIAILISLILVFCLEILDTMAMLPASIDFLKKLLSWVAMIALLYHVSLYHALFSGKAKKKVMINICLILAFILLSIKNISYVAFLTYGQEKWFSDLLLPIILYQNQMQTYLFFAGIIILLAITIYLTFFSELSAPSFASLIHKTEYNFIHARWKKPIYILLILLGFYIAFFNFFFDWFSISFDAPLLVLLLVMVIYGLAKHKEDKISEVTEASDTILKRFIKLFTHEKNLFVAFSAFPIFIFIIEIYNYLAYILFGIKSIYFEAIPFEMPTLAQLRPAAELLPLYLLQLTGLVSAVLLAFFFWWHFFCKAEKGAHMVKDNPYHPFLFAVFVTAVFAYLIKPVLTISTVNAKIVSGLVISLKSTDPTHLLLIYFGLSIFFVISYLMFRDIRKANIVPYSCVLISVSYLAILFLYSFIAGVDFQPLFGSFSILWINSLVMIVIAAIYSAILLFSVYSLVGEFLALEHFKETPFYRHVMLALFPHKLNLTESDKLLIKNYMETMLDQGYEDYLVIEHIHKEKNIPLKEISLMLRELEEDDEQKERYHQISHYHHNLEYIKKLHDQIRDLYYGQNMDAETIIDKCVSQGWTQDDIAAAMMHIKYKSKDKVLFNAMRKVGA